MDVKEAVKTAKSYVADLFEGEGLENIGLEEVVFEDGADVWKVTVGFSRRWDRVKGLVEVLSSNQMPEWNRRSFKVVRIEDGSGKVLSLTHRDPAA